MSDDFYEFIAELHKLQEKYKITKVLNDSPPDNTYVAGGVSIMASPSPYFTAWPSGKYDGARYDGDRIVYGYERYVWKDTDNDDR